MVGVGTIAGKRNPHKHQINLIKDMASMRPLGPSYRKAFELQDIVDRYPPRLSDPNEALVFSISSPPQSEHSGQVTVTRWVASALPEIFLRRQQATSIFQRIGYFTYDAPAAERMDWHLNFAHSDLFCAYGGPLFAQDEMQWQNILHAAHCDKHL
jgi:hypothetical protein